IFSRGAWSWAKSTGRLFLASRTELAGGSMHATFSFSHIVMKGRDTWQPSGMSRWMSFAVFWKSGPKGCSPDEFANLAGSLDIRDAQACARGYYRGILMYLTSMTAD